MIVGTRVRIPALGNNDGTNVYTVLAESRYGSIWLSLTEVPPPADYVEEPGSEPWNDRAAADDYDGYNADIVLNPEANNRWSVHLADDRCSLYWITPGSIELEVIE